MPGRIVDQQPSNRLILCFDGTGNVFQGTPGDTNIVKLYNMFDRNNTSQMHYYQPGIGTYPAEGPVNVNLFQTLMRKFDAVIDSALATSFDSHVIAGYRFVMRYYKPGDRIYIFGFSRGAFTARFLARMISHVGLLSIGNDELVPFVYKIYQKFEQIGKTTEEERKKHENFMVSFKNHFCRTETKEPSEVDAGGIKVHFLGLFDCVSSVGNLDLPFLQKAAALPVVTGTAKYVRHAVAIDERRVKFKAALFAQEENKEQKDNIKEVWFPGNHGDIGGGWDVKACEEKLHGHVHTDTTKDYFQLSDIALKWMIDEIDNVEAKTYSHPLAWNPETKKSFLTRFKKHQDQMIAARMHDTLTFDGGVTSKLKVMLWKVMEVVPWVIKRWEYVKHPENPKGYIWDYIGWPVNNGGRRDIPSTALFHQSVLSRMQLSVDPEQGRKRYAPNNELWVQVDDGQATTERRGKDPDVSDVTDPSQRPEPIKRNLVELAPRDAKMNGAHRGHETDPLVEPRKPQIQFVHDSELTVRSIDTKPETDPLKENWDNIYRVAFSHK